MSAAIAAALLFILAATIVHLSSIAIAALRCRCAADPLPPDEQTTGISLVRTIHGINPLEEETLRSSFLQSHAKYEVLFCAASEGDPAVACVRRLIAAFPDVDARLLIGDDQISANPKLNNMVKGWRAAKHEWIVFADSNLMLPPDYLDRVLAAWKPDTGIVCAPPVGSRPKGFWAEVECAFLNTYQARWQYAADSIGFGFAQGKTMLFRRDILENGGGIAALASELAEDAAATKVVRRVGLRVRLAGPSFFQPLGRRTAWHVLSRQTRWAQLRRLTFPGWFVLELLTGSAVPMLATALAALALDISPELAVAGFAAVWYGAEVLLARAGGWHVSWMSPFAWLLRDMLIPVIWLRAWTANAYKWGGHQVAWEAGGSASMSDASMPNDGIVGLR